MSILRMKRPGRRWTAVILAVGLAVLPAGILVLVVWANYGGSRQAAAMFTDIASPVLADPRARAEGACWGDYDADGDLDLFVANADGPSRLWRNDGGGAFADVARSAGIPASLRKAAGCAFIDIDNDGDLDLFVTSKNNIDIPSPENKLLRNNGDGTFTDLTAQARVGMPGAGVAASDWADFDGDADYDGFVATRFKGRDPKRRVNAFFEQTSPFVFRNIASVKGLADPVGPQSAWLGTWIDYDSDGDVDLLVGLDFWGVELFRNDNGTFTRVTTTAFPPAQDKSPGAPPNNPMGAAWGDFDNDGCLDVWISGTDLPGQGGFTGDTLGDLASRLFRNNCNGTFSDVTIAAGFTPTGLIQWSANFVDFDNDGDLDLSVVAGNASEDAKPRPNPIKRIFMRPAALLVGVVRGVLMVILPSPARTAESAYRYEYMVPAIGPMGLAAAMPNYLYKNLLVETGRTSFLPANELFNPPDLGSTLGSAWADFDNDGDLDWFVPNRGTPSRLYRNDGPVGNYLRVRLVGNPMRDAVGALVKIKVGNTYQIRHLHVLDGYLSQSQMDPHFGLGRAGRVDEVWVRWPNTTTWVSVCKQVPANRRITVTEGQGCRW